MKVIVYNLKNYRATWTRKETGLLIILRVIWVLNFDLKQGCMNKGVLIFWRIFSCLAMKSSLLLLFTYFRKIISRCINSILKQFTIFFSLRIDLMASSRNPLLVSTVKKVNLKGKLNFSFFLCETYIPCLCYN